MFVKQLSTPIIALFERTFLLLSIFLPTRRKKIDKEYEMRHPRRFHSRGGLSHAQLGCAAGLPPFYAAHDRRRQAASGVYARQTRRQRVERRRRVDRTAQPSGLRLQ